jgi:hypothetical protein
VQGSKLERLAMGEPTDSSKSEVTGPGGGPFQVEMTDAELDQRIAELEARIANC